VFSSCFSSVRPNPSSLPQGAFETLEFVGRARHQFIEAAQFAGPAGPFHGARNGAEPKLEGLQLKFG